MENFKGTDIDWIKKEAYKLVKKHWKIDYIPTIEIDITPQDEWDDWFKVNFNNDSSLWGLYHSNKKTIEFNTKTNSNLDSSTIRKILLHELCHWYLHHNNLPYRDADKRFGHELIRVGLRPNTVPSHTNAYKEARRDKSWRTFELIDNGEDKISTKLYHPRKNTNDFIRDLKEVMEFLKDEHEKLENDEIESSDYEQVYAGEVASILESKYGYEVEEYPKYSIIMGDDHGNIDLHEMEYLIDQLENDMKKVR